MGLGSYDHNEEQITWFEQTEIEWFSMLKEFDEKVWPVYKERGYSKDAALLHWELTYHHGRLHAIEELLREQHS